MRVRLVRIGDREIPVREPMSEEEQVTARLDDEYAVLAEVWRLIGEGKRREARRVVLEAVTSTLQTEPILTPLRTAILAVLRERPLRVYFNKGIEAACWIVKQERGGSLYTRTQLIQKACARFKVPRAPVREFMPTVDQASTGAIDSFLRSVARR